MCKKTNEYYFIEWRTYIS